MTTVRTHSTEGIVLRKYNTSGAIISTNINFDDSPNYHSIAGLLGQRNSIYVDDFQRYMFKLLERQSQIHEEITGRPPSNLLLGTYEYKRFKQFFRKGPDQKVKEFFTPAEEFPLTAALREYDDTPRQVGVSRRETLVPTETLFGWTVVKHEHEYFHMELL